MVIHEADRAVARRMFHVAIGVVAMRDESTTVREAAVDAIRRPSPSTIRGLLVLGRGKPWLGSVIDALAEVGVAAAEDVLGGEHDE